MSGVGNTSRRGALQGGRGRGDLFYSAPLRRRGGGGGGDNAAAAAAASPILPTHSQETGVWRKGVREGWRERETENSIIHSIAHKKKGKESGRQKKRNTSHKEKGCFTFSSFFGEGGGKGGGAASTEDKFNARQLLFDRRSC